MAIQKSAHALGQKATPTPMGSELVVCRASVTVSAPLAAGDLLKMMTLPAGCVPVDLILDTDDMGTTGAVSVGLGNDTMTNGVYTEATDLDTAKSGGAAWLTNGDVATAATGLRADAGGLRAMARCAADGTRARPVFVKVTTATTATTGTIGLTLKYRAAD